MIKFVMCSLPGKIMFSTFFCRHSTPAPLIEPQSAWNVRVGRRNGPGRITLQKQALYRWAGERTKMRILRTKNEKKILGKGHRPLPKPTSSGEGDNLSPYPNPHILSAPSAPLSLRLRRSTWSPPKPNPGSGSDRNKGSLQISGNANNWECTV